MSLSMLQCHMFFVMVISSGQHGSWRRSSPAVEASPLVLSWHVQVQIGRMLVHTLSPAVPLEDRKEALEFVHEQSYSEILRESLSPGLEVRMLQLICWQKWLFILHANQRRCDILLWLFADSYHICVSNQSTAHMHTSSVGRKTVTFHCAAADIQ